MEEPFQIMAFQFCRGAGGRVSYLLIGVAKLSQERECTATAARPGLPK